MTAKESFEQLGWKDCNDKSAIVSYTKEYGECDQWITFTKEKEIVFETSPDDFAPVLTYEEIKAIEKQILEMEGNE